MADIKKIALIGGAVLVIVAAFALLSSKEGGGIVFWLLLIGVFGGVIALVFWYLNKPKVLSPTKKLFESLRAGGAMNVPNSIRGYRLMTRGDNVHTFNVVGIIEGWVNLTKYAGFDYVYGKDEITGKSVRLVDDNGTPKRKYWSYKEDVIEEHVNYDGIKELRLIHSKGEIRKWNESNFVIVPNGFLNKFLGKRTIIRVPETMHSTLSGDVQVYSISFMPLPALGDLWILNDYWNSPQYRQQLYDEIEGITFNMMLDNVAVSTDKAMNSNVDLGLGTRSKDLIIPQTKPQTGVNNAQV